MSDNNRIRIELALVLVIVHLFGCHSHRPVPGYAYEGDDLSQMRQIDLSAFQSPESRPGPHRTDRAVALSISGGGHRSANLAIGVMLGLEQITDDESGADALREIDYLSSVSGGGLAAAAYLTSLDDHLRFGGASDSYRLADKLRAGEIPSDRADGLGDPQLKQHLRRGYVYNLAMGFLSPFAVGTLHNGNFLELKFDDEILGARWRRQRLEELGRPEEPASFDFSRVFVPRDADRPVRLPFWVPGATIYGNGAIFPFSPDTVTDYRVRQFAHRFETVDVDPMAKRSDALKMPYAVALCASGVFPAIIPPTKLVCDRDPEYPYLYLLDGGLSDNLGVFTAIQLLGQFRDPPSKKVLIVVDAFTGNLSPYSHKRFSPTFGKAMMRTTRIGMDSWRSRYRAAISEILSTQSTTGPGNDVLILGFDDLRDLRDYEKLFGLGFAESDLKAIIKHHRLDDSVRPFDLARAIHTSYRLTVAEQSFLFAAGRYTVDANQSRIKRVLFE